jgi:hypothetical protein
MSVFPGNRWRLSVLGLVLSLVVLPSGAGDQAPKQSTQHVPVVEDLVQLLQARPDLRAALEGAIRTAALKGLPEMDSFLIYLDGFVTFVPSVNELPSVVRRKSRCLCFVTGHDFSRAEMLPFKGLGL